MHTCVFFTLICLACFPSSATARTDWFSDGHFSAEIDLSQAGGGGGYVEKCQNISISNRCKFDRFFRVTTCQQPRRLQHVFSRRRRPGSEHVVPAAKRHFIRRIWPQTARGSLGTLAPLGSLAPHYRRARTCMHTCIFVFLSQWYWRYLPYKEFY